MDESKLIDLVQAHPELYDKTNEKFKDKTHKENLWKEIGAEMLLDHEACQNKWSTLKRYFAKRHNCGKTDWVYYQKLNFLENHLYKKKHENEQKPPVKQGKVTKSTENKKCNTHFLNYLRNTMSEIGPARSASLQKKILELLSKA